MNEQSPSLAKISGLWLEDSPPTRQAHYDRLRRARWQNLAWMTSESFIALIGCAVGGWLVIQSQPLVGTAAIGFSISSLAISLLTRLRLSKVVTEPVISAVQSSLAELEAQFRIAVGGCCVCIGALVFIAVVALSAGLSATSEASDKTLGMAILFVAAAFVWSIARLRRLNRQCIRFAVASEHLRASVRDESVEVALG